MGRLVLNWVCVLALVALASCEPTGGVGGAPPVVCEGSQDCGDNEICDPFLSPQLCASLACTDGDDDQCPTGYACHDDSCWCGDGCFPDECEIDSDCGFGQFCRGDFPARCEQFHCGGDAALGPDCIPDPDEECEFSPSGCPPAGSSCVDNPRSECEMATDPSCTGVCVVP